MSAYGGSKVILNGDLQRCLAVSPMIVYVVCEPSSEPRL